MITTESTEEFNKLTENTLLKAFIILKEEASNKESNILDECSYYVELSVVNKENKKEKNIISKMQTLK